jgi:hypothetical protein
MRYRDQNGQAGPTYYPPMGFWKRHKERETDRSLRVMVPRLKQASDSRWGDFIGSIEFEGRPFFNA